MIPSFHISKEEMKAILAKMKAKKEKRLAKRLVFSGRPTLLTLSELKEKAWKLKSLRIRLEGKRNHFNCFLCHKNTIQDAGHLVPKSRGLAIYFDDRNLIAICKPCNFGDMMNRSQYREKYVAIFGRQRIEMLEHLSNETKQLSRSDYLEIIAQETLKLEVLK
ncbi:MAG: recombination protein NinG [Chlamydiales bacterium]